MLSTDLAYLNMNDSLARTIKGKVEHYSGSTLLETYSYNDALQNIHVDRTAALGKFFGFGVSQKLTLKLTDKDRLKTVTKGDKFRIYFSANDSEYLRVGPDFTVDDVKRDEKTNGITVIAFDPISELSKHTFEELGILATECSLETVLSACGTLLGLSIVANYESWGSMATLTGIPNYDGSENLREVLDDIAEAVQAVYFCDARDVLYMKELRPNETADITVGKNDYFELTTEPAQVLSGIAHVTDLGNNLQAGEGTVQVIRNNAFLETFGLITEQLDQALARVTGLSIVPFTCSWRGNFAAQIGDRVALVDKNGTTVYSYILNDSYEYSGGFKETTSWSYEKEQTESVAPTTIGEKINQTYARIDRVNNEIVLLTSSVDEQGDSISQLVMSGDSIRSSVESLITDTQSTLDGVNKELSSLAKKVEASMTEEQVQLIVSQSLGDGVDKVTTSTGFTFDDDGLHIKKSSSDMESLLDEKGLTVSRRGTEMLSATSEGVSARNLSAQEFLRIENVRFERYNRVRMGCFWVGE